MQCTKPVRIFPKKRQANLPGIKTDFEKNNPNGLLVPCGKCLSCRIKKRKEWSIRILHELEAHDDSIFITLTYTDNHLPANNSLSKRDLQLFFKRLRRNLAEEKRFIRYYACGEYGDITERPHYHAIIFGMSLHLEDKMHIMTAWPFADWDVPAIRKNSFGLAEPDSINYVAQYIDKKYSGDKAIEEYKNKGREPVFRVCSLGIGRNYVDTHAEQIKQNLHLSVRGVKHSLPRYYLNRLDISSDLLKDDAYKKEVELVKRLSGFSYSFDEAYDALRPDEILKIEDGRKKSNAQNELNLQAKINLKTKKL